MSAPSAENTPTAGVVVAIREFLDALPEKTGLAECIAEGRAVAEIVEPLGLPNRILAAVHAYPAYREGFLSYNSFYNKELKDIPRFCLGLAQLDQFTLPSHWQPGDALADKQSESLRKMLLAIVSDVRLVLVRIAEQLHRLRQAKQAPEAERQALAQETREIYAPLANRLGIWQLKWELEDLAFRYLEPDTYAEIARNLKEKRAERVGFIEGFQSILHQADVFVGQSGGPIFGFWAGDVGPRAVAVQSWQTSANNGASGSMDMRALVAQARTDFA